MQSSKLSLNTKPSTLNKIAFSELFNIVDLTFIYELVPGKKKKVGRKKTDALEILKGLLYQMFTSAALRDLEVLFAIDHSTFSKKRKDWQHLGVFKKLFQYLVKQLIDLKVIQTFSIAGDSSTIEAWSNIVKNSERKEFGAGWARQKGQGYREYGYKVHALCDTHSELPIALLITGANEYDGNFLIPLLADFKERYPKLHIKYVAADKAYDDEEILKWIVKELKALAAIPAKDNRTVESLKKTRKYRAERKRNRNKRTAIERMLSRGKRGASLGTLRTKGKARVTAHVLLSFCLLLVISLAAFLLKARHLMKSFSWLSQYAY